MQYLLPQVPGEDWGEKGTIPSSPIRVALNQSNQSLWYSTYCTMFLERTEGEGMGDHPILLKGSYSDIVLTGPGSRRGLRRERRGTIQSSSKGVTHVGLAVRGSYVPHGSGLSPISFFFVHLWNKETNSHTELTAPGSRRRLRRERGTIQSSSKGVSLALYYSWLELLQVPGETERGGDHPILLKGGFHLTGAPSRIQSWPPALNNQTTYQPYNLSAQKISNR